MIVSFIARVLVLIFGYAYPAYECYKTVEKNKPEIEHLRFWCQYWILVAFFTICERVGDALFSWFPMYSEAKVAFFIYLWYPKTQGTTYVYDSFFRPYVAKHENEIDRNLLELKTRAGDVALSYSQRAARYGQIRVLEILQYISARPHPAQQPAAAPNRQPSTTPKRQVAAAKPETQEPPSPTSSTSSSEDQIEVAEKVGRSPVQEENASPETSIPSSTTKAEETQVEAVPSPPNENENSPTKETSMDEAVRVTSARLRKIRSGSKS